MEANALYTHPSLAETANGNSGEIGFSAYDELAVDIDVTALSATSITFFVDRLGADGVWYVVWTSSALTGTGTASASIGAGLSTAASFGLTGRLAWVFVGSSPSATFTASILAK